MPDFDGVDKCAIRPPDPGELAHHHSPAIRLLAVDNLRLDVKDFQPHAKVRLDSKRFFADGDEGRDMKKRIRSQVVEVPPVEEHQSSDKRVEREA